MANRHRLLPLALLGALWGGAAAAEPCAATEAEAAFHALDLRLQAGQRLALPVTPDWTLVFQPVDLGWQVRLNDPNRLDLSQVTPPLHGPNPRDLLGWHFRNAANSGPNLGEVNAPQFIRDFLFDPALSGTGGFRPSDGSGGLQPEGRGRITLRDLALSPPQPGSQAALLSAGVEVCLTWPKAAEPDVAQTDLALLIDCGLEPGRYTLHGAIDPPMLRADLDGDGAPDTLALLDDRQGEGLALAACLGGTRLDLLPAGHPALPAQPLQSMENWLVFPPDSPQLLYQGAPPWPDAEGDFVALERFEKSMDLLYRQAGDWRGLPVFRVITAEP